MLLDGYFFATLITSSLWTGGQTVFGTTRTRQRRLEEEFQTQYLYKPYTPWVELHNMLSFPKALEDACIKFYGINKLDLRIPKNWDERAETLVHIDNRFYLNRNAYVDIDALRCNVRLGQDEELPSLTFYLTGEAKPNSAFKFIRESLTDIFAFIKIVDVVDDLWSINVDMNIVNQVLGLPSLSNTNFEVKKEPDINLLTGAIFTSPQSSPSSTAMWRGTNTARQREIRIVTSQNIPTPRSGSGSDSPKRDRTESSNASSRPNEQDDIQNLRRIARYRQSSRTPYDRPSGSASKRPSL